MDGYQENTSSAVRGARSLHEGQGQGRCPGIPGQDLVPSELLDSAL